MSRFIVFAFAVLFVVSACGAAPSASDAGSPADAGTLFVATGTISGNVQFTAASAFSVWRRLDGGAAGPAGVILSDAATVCPADLSAFIWAVDTRVILAQLQHGLLEERAYPADAFELRVIVATFGSGHVPYPLLAVEAGSVTVEAIEPGGVRGGMTLQGEDGGSVTATFAAKTCGPYCGQTLCP